MTPQIPRAHVEDAHAHPYTIQTPQTTDLTVPAIGVNLAGPAAPPAYNPATMCLEFVAGATRTIQISYQLPHSYAEGGDVEFHVHWAASSANIGTVRWEVTWRWFNRGTTMPAFVVAPTVDATSSGIVDREQITDIITMPGGRKNDLISHPDTTSAARRSRHVHRDGAGHLGGHTLPSRHARLTHAGREIGGSMTTAQILALLVPVVSTLVGATWYLGRSLSALGTEIEAVRGEIRALRATVEAETRERVEAETETRAARARCGDRFFTIGERIARLEAKYAHMD